MLRLILIGELFFQNFQSLEIIGDMYESRYGGVLSLSVKFSRSKKNRFDKFDTSEKKIMKIWKKMKKLREESMEIIRAFRGTGQTSRVGSGRGGSADPTRPAKNLKCVVTY